jgi:hypothetical protein
MPGPNPKFPEQRRRRNAPASGEWVTLPAEPFVGDQPKMPELRSLEAVLTWELWWSSPMAHMWTEADWPGLLRLIFLIDSEARGLDHLKEIRMQEERFGLSPKGRQSLHWRLSEPEEPTKGKVLVGRWADLKVVDATS